MEQQRRGEIPLETARDGGGSAPGREYRAALYGRYASVQVPGWLTPDPGADAVWARAALRRLRGWLPADRSAEILDIGCGAGHLLEALRSAGYRNLRGLDVSPEAVAIARTRHADVHHANLRDYLQETHETFDLICAFDVIEHFRKDEILHVLTLIWKCLNPSGILVLQTPNAMSPWAAHYRYRDLTHELIFSPECLVSTLTLCGFRSIELREVQPYVHGIKSCVRWGLWKLVWAASAIWNLAETGGLCGGIYSRNMMLRAVKNEGFQW